MKLEEDDEFKDQIITLGLLAGKKELCEFDADCMYKRAYGKDHCSLHYAQGCDLYIRLKGEDRNDTNKDGS